MDKESDDYIIADIKVSIEKVSENINFETAKTDEEKAAFFAMTKELSQKIEEMTSEIKGMAEKFNVDPYNDDELRSLMQKVYTLKSIIPKTYYMPNSKIINDMIPDGEVEQEIELRVNNYAIAKEVFAYYSLTFSEQDENVTISNNLTNYDREVMNSMTSLYVAGNFMVTPPQIIRCMLGMKESEKVSDNQIKEVMASVNKLRTTIVTIDATEQIKQMNPVINGQKITKHLYSDNLINVRAEMMVAGGREVYGYIIKEVPVLYEYSRNIGQVVSVDPKLLDTRSATKNTAEIIAIKGYLLRRISYMKFTKQNSSTHILYDSIFHNSSIKTENKTQLKRYRDSIKKILDEWIKEGFFKKYIDLKKGKSIIGIDIEF